MADKVLADKPQAAPGAQLQRSVGFWGLTFISLGSIIGSGWLLGALSAAVVAGPASLVSWVIGAGILTVLALTYAELGGSYPVSGGAARYPYFAFGALGGFAAGWPAGCRRSRWRRSRWRPPSRMSTACTGCTRT
jgi:amino acid transporter